MSHPQRVAVVTGGNRGIGLEICRQLARQDVLVVMACRDERRGAEACLRLQKEEELTVRSRACDVAHAGQIERLAGFVQKEFGRCDILVNNAAVFLDSQAQGRNSSVLGAQIETLRETLEINLYGPLLLAQAIIPLMKKKRYGRIVNMSSGLGQLAEMAGGYPSYRLSKTAINALTRMLAAELAGSGILVNSCCPGWVRTEMGGPDAPRVVEEGAETPAWLATLPEDGPTGGFFRDRQPIPW